MNQRERLTKRLKLSPKQLEWYEERAAIMQYDGGLSKVESEDAALIFATWTIAKTADDTVSTA